jgi:hypothetical protein
MSYEAKITLKFDSTWDRKGGIYDDEIIPEEHITFECPVDDLNSIQLFQFFAKFASAMGHNEAGIAKGAAYVAFNEMRSTEDMRKTAEEYDLKLIEDYSKEISDLDKEVYQLTNTIKDLKAKLSRLENPDNPNYTDEEMDALCAENEVTADTLKNADVVCKDCGSKYGHYSVSCSSTWTGKCDVCGQEKSVTESRDWNYLKEGIDYLSK